ncbi:MAG: hypothetical protein JOZ46_07900 [Candidatus Dormibacteraeota bacterium]|nr:hypothetical protein [Candidatus Dormibacteraeota bacterium]MBV9525720.1 hypothetical protein [Candidatus Dormibacteraeota bacterium]
MPGTPQRPEHWMRMQPRHDMNAHIRRGADSSSRADVASRARDGQQPDGAEAFVRESIRDRYYR